MLQALCHNARMPRMEHVTVRLPSELAEELRREAQARGFGMSWAMRRRLEAGRETGSRQSRRPEGNESRGGGGKLRARTEAVTP